MAQVSRIVAGAMSLALVTGMMCSNSVAQANRTEPADTGKIQRAEPFDPVTFVKAFKIGMSYVEVQAALPKNAEQDALAYVPSEESFLLGVDLPGAPVWSATFKFDTLDMPARRPEELVEFSCSAGLSTRSESFETIVRKVTAAFGEPIEVDRSEDRFQQAGWRVGGSLLTLEYSRVSGAGKDNVTIEFLIKKKLRRDLPDGKAVA